MFDEYEEYDRADAACDAYWEAVEAFWYANRPSTYTKDWEELSSWQHQQASRDYEEDLMKRSRPEQFYCTGGI